MNLPQIESGIEGKLPPTRSKLAADYVAIEKEEIPLEEKLMAIYSKAVTHLNDFSPKRIPGASQEFITDHQDYKKADKDDKKAAWKAILDKHSGYLKSVDDAVAENNSNIYFLKEMELFFNERGMTNYAEKIRALIIKHEEYKYQGA